MHKFKSTKFPHISRTIVQFDHADQSELSNICRSAAERFKEAADGFRKLIDFKPIEGEQVDDQGRRFIDMTPHGEGAKRLAEQFDRQAQSALAYATMFDEVDSIPDMVMDDDEDAEAA
jgi:hypothetical protein